MKVLRVLGVTLLCIAFALSLASAQPKKRIAVSRFNDGAHYHGCGTGIADMLATALVKSGKFIVIERQDLDKVLDEQRLGASGVITAETAPAMGKVLGVDMVVVGSVSELGTKKSDIGGGASLFGVGISSKGARAVVDIRLINTTTGEIMAAESEEGTESSIGFHGRYEDINFSDMNAWDDTDLGKAAREAINGCVELIVENMESIPWSGRVIKANTDGTVLIKPGSEGNVNVGDEFDIFQAGEEIKDPDTGLSMGSEETKVAHIKVTAQMLNGKAAKATVVSGKGIKTGDIVRQPAD
jgi:curli biogenesis system outer membrane secretion channel CsgG